MTFSVLIACPDRHLVYDGRTPEIEGIGGGVTARVRVAKALAAHGARVSVHANCLQRKKIDGVDYIPLDKVPSSPDVLVATTSGGDYDLGPIPQVARQARLKIAWLHGPDKPSGFEALGANVVYAVSNFVCEEIKKWSRGDAPPVFVSYNGFDNGAFAAAESFGLARDPYRLAYTSHPSKGLEAALGILARLRRLDDRYHLDIFGGESLWGEPDVQRPETAGVRFHGRVGQRQLAQELLRSSFALCLQVRQEPFGYALTEAMRAGCVVIASPVGAFPELIRDGVDGYLVSGSPDWESTLTRATKIVLGCTRNVELTQNMRQAASQTPWTADQMARTWLEHWGYMLDEDGVQAESGASCQTCGTLTLALADGQHCPSCGRFQRPDWRANLGMTPSASASGRSPVE